MKVSISKETQKDFLSENLCWSWLSAAERTIDAFSFIVRNVSQQPIRVLQVFFFFLFLFGFWTENKATSVIWEVPESDLRKSPSDCIVECFFPFQERAKAHCEVKLTSPTGWAKNHCICMSWLFIMWNFVLSVSEINSNRIHVPKNKVNQWFRIFVISSGNDPCAKKKKHPRTESETLCG